jgi:hypothetical protein
VSREVHAGFCERRGVRVPPATHLIVGFEHQGDARRFLGDLRDRLAKFALELSAEKTRLIEFGRFAAERRARRGDGRPETFEFLGFTHVCAKSRAGRFKLKRISSSKRVRAKLRELKRSLMQRRHLPIPSRGAGWVAWCEGTSTTTPCPTTATRSMPSAPRSLGTGSGRFDAAASVQA